MMKQKEKLEKIERIIKKAEKDFQPADLVYVKDKKGNIIGVGMTDTKAQEQKKLESNFDVYAKALDKIHDLLGLKAKIPKIK